MNLEYWSLALREPCTQRRLSWYYIAISDRPLHESIIHANRSTALHHILVKYTQYIHTHATRGQQTAPAVKQTNTVCNLLSYTNNLHHTINTVLVSDVKINAMLVNERRRLLDNEKHTKKCSNAHTQLHGTAIL